MGSLLFLRGLTNWDGSSWRSYLHSAGTMMQQHCTHFVQVPPFPSHSPAHLQQPFAVAADVVQAQQQLGPFLAMQDTLRSHRL